MTEILIDHIFAFQTKPLRQRVLRPMQTVDELTYKDDHHSRTIHFGAFVEDQLVGIVSIYKQPNDAFPMKSSFRLRGMAVDPAFQGNGIGEKLIEASIAHAKDKLGDVLWCEARTSAEGFYAKYGFYTQGDVYDKPPIGPHIHMCLDLT